MRCHGRYRVTWDACSLQYTAAAQRVFRADRNAKYVRLTILDKEAGAVHYDEDDERMYLGARACHRLCRGVRPQGAYCFHYSAASMQCVAQLPSQYRLCRITVITTAPAITSPDYHQRAAFNLLETIQAEIVKHVGARISRAPSPPATSFAKSADIWQALSRICVQYSHTRSYLLRMHPST